MELVTNRRVNEKLINQLTPISQIDKNSILSPSRLDQDQLLLPYMTKNKEFLDKNVENLKNHDQDDEKSQNPYSIENIKISSFDKKQVNKSKSQSFTTYRV